MVSSLRNLMVIVLVSTAALLSSCVYPFCPSTADSAVLNVDIIYTGYFYWEVFGYSREADYIHHYVLVVPEGLETRVTPSELFHQLLFQANPDDPLTENPDLAWTQNYLYEAPEGRFQGEFEPGSYYVAVAFIAPPITREEANVPEDTLLYAGITGGGASTDFMRVDLEPGHTTDMRITMNDDHGWACPWLYVHTGLEFVRQTEVLRNLRGKSNERAEFTSLGSLTPIDGAIVVRLSEEKDEISFVNEFYLVIEGITVQAEVAPPAVTALDNDYLMITSGESVDFVFRLPESLANQEQVSVSAVVSGYYLPCSPRRQLRGEVGECRFLSDASGVSG